MEIIYRPGKSNANADALSHCPLDVDEVDESLFGIVAALRVDVQSKDREPGFRERQIADEALPGGSQWSVRRPPQGAQGAC